MKPSVRRAFQLLEKGPFGSLPKPPSFPRRQVRRRPRLDGTVKIRKPKLTLIKPAVTAVTPNPNSF